MTNLETIKEIKKWKDNYNLYYLQDKKNIDTSIKAKRDKALNNLLYACDALIRDALKSEIDIIDKELIFRPGLAKRSKTELIILHHTACETATILDVHSWHLQKGWNGCGYHFFINKKGEIFRGRPIEMIGAHCEGSNAYSIGICNEGNYEIEIGLLKEQTKANVKLIKYLKSIPEYSHVKVVGHKDKYATKCPGKYFPLNLLEHI